jgi:hypothetical protein
MTHLEIVTSLSLTCPSNVIYELTMETVISAIVRRMGEESLDLSAGGFGAGKGRSEGCD